MQQGAQGTNVGPCGGAADSRQGSLERHLRDARAAAVMAPTTELLHDFIGKALTGRELF